MSHNPVVSAALHTVCLLMPWSVPANDVECAGHRGSSPNVGHGVRTVDGVRVHRVPRLAGEYHVFHAVVVFVCNNHLDCTSPRCS